MSSNNSCKTGRLVISSVVGSFIFDFFPAFFGHKIRARSRAKENTKITRFLKNSSQNKNRPAMGGFDAARSLEPRSGWLRGLKDVRTYWQWTTECFVIPVFNKI